MQETISREAAARLIRQSAGKIFTVTFVKRGDRKKMHSTPYDRLPRRRLTGRTGVRKGLTGAGKRFDDRAHDLVTVAELVAQRGERGRFAGGSFQYRAVPVEGIERLTVDGKTFTVA